MVETLEESAPSYSTVKKWAAQFKLGRESLEDDSHPGRPKTVITDETTGRIHDMIMEDRRLTEPYIATELGISQERVHAIIHNDLQTAKVSARWVPKLLEADHKQQSLSMSRDNLGHFYVEPEKFLQQCVTIDETWVHHFQSETKEQSKHWKHYGFPPPKKARVVLSAGKVMASIFLDSEGVLLVDCLQTGRTVNGAYYANLVKQLRVKLKEKH